MVTLRTKTKKRKVFNLNLKMTIELEILMSSGKLFQRHGAQRKRHASHMILN